MQLKLRHLILFILACALLIFADTPGGAILALAVFMQMSILLHGFELTKKSQISVFKLLLVSIPLFLFWGGIHSFVFIYLSEGQYIFFFMALSISLVMCFMAALQVVFSYSFLKNNNFEMIATLQDAFNNIKNRKQDFFTISFLLFLFSFVPWLKPDWKLVFTVAATHSYLNWNQLKKALSVF